MMLASVLNVSAHRPSLSDQHSCCLGLPSDSASASESCYVGQSSDSSSRASEAGKQFQQAGEDVSLAAGSN